MSRSTTEAFTVSVALHIVAVATLFVLGLLAEWFQEDPPVIMQLVDLSMAYPQSAAPTRVVESIPDEPPPPALEALEVPRMEQLKPVPNIPPPVAEPNPPPVSKPTPTPVAEPEPQRISFSEHVQQHGRPPVTPARPTTRAPTPTPTIQTDVRNQLEHSLSTPKLTSTTNALSSAQVSALELYVAGIQQKLQQVFRPVGVPGLRATIEFTVVPSGTFTAFKVVRSSGDPAFDAAALATFTRVARVGPTPDGRAYTWEIDFRSKI